MKLNQVSTFVAKPCGKASRVAALSAALVLPATTSVAKTAEKAIGRDTASLSGSLYILGDQANGLLKFNSKKTPSSFAALIPVNGPARGAMKDLGLLSISDSAKYYMDGEYSALTRLSTAFSEASKGKSPTDASSGAMRQLLDKFSNRNTYVYDLNKKDVVGCVRLDKVTDSSRSAEDGFVAVTRDNLGADESIRQGADVYAFSGCKDASGAVVDENGQKVSGVKSAFVNMLSNLSENKIASNFSKIKQ